VDTFVVGAMAHLITSRERHLARSREEQLRSEQLLALGIASAQVTHQLATPLSNMQLLFDELSEDFPQVQAVQAMAYPLQQCTSQLNYFRTLASDIRENAMRDISAMQLFEDLIDSVSLQYPQTQFTVRFSDDTNIDYRFIMIHSDAMLQPALLNLIQNGIHSNAIVGERAIAVEVVAKKSKLFINIRDFGAGLVVQSQPLGEQLVASENGLGMAMLLSNTTFERLNGSLTLIDHHQQGAVAQVVLPIIEMNKQEPTV